VPHYYKLFEQHNSPVILLTTHKARVPAPSNKPEGTQTLKLKF